MADTLHFYRDLSALRSFAEAVETGKHRPVPTDWWIVVADVSGSTQAITAGNYKAVNTVGVSCIAALLNVDRDLELPFVFGGDGATFAIPGSLVEAALPALRGAQRLARSGFALELRVGLVNVAELRAAGHGVALAKVALSEFMTQATFSGSGWAEAERRIKAGAGQGVLCVHADAEPAHASFDGFECRWSAVPHFNGHKLSLLVAAMPADALTVHKVYQEVAERIAAIYGDVDQYHPLRAGEMRLTFDPALLRHEWRVRTLFADGWQRLRLGAHLLFANVAGWLLFATGRDTAAMRWSRYRDDLVRNTDFRKFDGMLRMVIDGSETQAAALEQYLEGEYQAGRLVYGTFRSDAALVTCLVRSYNGDHLHFVDGSDGGYALAAQGLKRRLEERGNQTGE